MHLQICVPDLSSNTAGRAYCLWLLARELGWTATVVGNASEDGLWFPLQGTPFQSDCLIGCSGEGADVIVAVAPIPGSFDVALSAGRTERLPVVLDVDEAHWEARWGHTRVRRFRAATAMTLHGRNPVPVFRLRRAAQRVVTLISNPALQRLYPGVVIPHVRPLTSSTASTHTNPLRIGFLGTVRWHKGLEYLRDAASDVGAQLTVTASRPADARPNEHFVGSTSMVELHKLLDAQDVVVVPSIDTPFSRLQLPAKLVDAMSSGKAILASRLPPIEWATADTALLVEPGSVKELTRALTTLTTDPARRAALGEAARERAASMFTPEAVAPLFARAIRDAVRCGPVGTRKNGRSIASRGS